MEKLKAPINSNLHACRRKGKSQTNTQDMIFTGSEFLPLIEFCKIKPAIIQSIDHQSVFLKYRPGLSERRNGYRKININLVSYKERQERIKYLIDKCMFKKDTLDCRLF